MNTWAPKSGPKDTKKIRKDMIKTSGGIDQHVGLWLCFRLFVVPTPNRRVVRRTSSFHSIPQQPHASRRGWFIDVEDRHKIGCDFTTCRPGSISNCRLVQTASRPLIRKG